MDEAAVRQKLKVLITRDLIRDEDYALSDTEGIITSGLMDSFSLAEMAVYVEPESAIYRDTLAEILFQLGLKTEALQIEQASVLDDPGQWHLLQQIKKYREAVASEQAIETGL